MWNPFPPMRASSWGRWTSRIVDYIEGLSPAISIDQKTTSKNPRSTVGTVTEIYDYLRLLYARIGVPHCPVCGREIRQQTVDQIVDQVLALPERTRIQVLAPVVRGRKGEHVKELESCAPQRLRARARATGSSMIFRSRSSSRKNKKHTIEIVVDRLVISARHPLAAGGFASRRPRNLTGGIWWSIVHGRRGHTPFRRTMPARSTASALRSSRRACSRSTIPTAPARSAPAWACS